MKALFIFVLVLLLSSVVYFFASKNEDLSGPTEIEKLNNQASNPHKVDPSPSREKTSSPNNETLEHDHDNHNHQHQHNHHSRDGDQEEEIVRDGDYEDTPEYSEEVSEEDFKEFISVALEELSSSDDMAEAIIVEMQKIGAAQPDHLEQVKFFYRECATNTSLSSDNQQLCQSFLDKIDE